MLWTFSLRFDILATVLSTFPNIGQIFVQFSGHSASTFAHYLQVLKDTTLTNIRLCLGPVL
jgi:hypothetical protein